MRRLWLADIHANLPALEAVLADAGDGDEVAFVGDVVGYGPHPAACVDRLARLSPRAVRGNHDSAVLAATGPTAGPGLPLDWDAWSRAELSAGARAYLEALPGVLDLDLGSVAALVTHHPPGAPYLHPDMPDAVLWPHLHAAWPDAPGQAVWVCAHSHRTIDRRLAGRRYVCVPPVGQPRDGDPRAGYAVEIDGVFTFRRVVYDVEATVAAVSRIGLAPAFVARWVRFLRTGWDAEWSRDYPAAVAHPTL